MKSTKGLPSILDVLDLVGISYQYNGDCLSFDTWCPFCNEKNKPYKKKLNINVAKNLFVCPRCGNEGGILDLYKKYHPNITSNNEAAIALKADVAKGGICNCVPQYDIAAALKRVSPVADLATRDETYKALLSFLTLEQTDKEMLLERGLSEKAIERLGYKSISQGFNYDIAKKLINNGYKLKGVAGFVRYKSRWCLNSYASGILIPFKNYEGLISQLQIRKREKDDKKRYTALSTKRICESNPLFTEGSAAISCTHLVGYTGQDTVYITEGALKGDIACYFAKKIFKKQYAFLCMAGVNNKNDLLKTLTWLKASGVKTIIDAFDMDKMPNTPIFNNNVYKALNSLIGMITEVGLHCKLTKWDIGSDSKNYLKGIDDYYKKKYDNMLLKEQEAA